MNTANEFFVSVQGDRIIMLKAAREFSKAEALNLAAWLVALADDRDEFPALLEAIRNT